MPRKDTDRVLTLKEKVAMQPRRVDFWWIKGHEDSFGNNLADLLAKRARNDQLKYKEPVYGKPERYDKAQ